MPPQPVVAAITSNAANRLSGGVYENSRRRKTVRVAKAMIVARRTMPTSRTAGTTIRAGLTISRTPVTRHHQCGYTGGAHDSTTYAALV